MSTSCGFFNSLNHDRRYDASAFGKCFEGIILDGVLASIGDCFSVKASSGMTVTVGSGKSWFLSSWLKNDAELPVMLDTSDVVLGRIDAVIMEFDVTETVRWNDIKVVKGTLSSIPEWPVLKNSQTVKQVPLAYIAVRPNTTEITQADITNMVGTSACPFVTGVLETVDIDDLVAKWESQWDIFYTEHTGEMQQAFEDWQKQWDSWFKSQTSDASSEVSNWINARQSEFDEWFASLQEILSGDTAANLADRILGVENEVKTLATKSYVDSLSTRVSIILPASGWSGDTQAVSVPGLTAAADVIVAPDPVDDSNFEAYTESGVRCVAQTAEKLIFRCESAPSMDLTVNVEIKL